MKRCNKPLPRTLRAGHHEQAFRQAMVNRINNAICLFIAAAVFAMIGLESGDYHAYTQPAAKVQR